MLEEGGRDAREAMLSIGALSRASGIPVETLRTWERRYGYPIPERKPSGHRVYSVQSVPRLRRIAEAIAYGHRAGDVVGASDEVLAALLRASGGVHPPQRREPAGESSLPRLLQAVGAFDGETLTRLLLAEYARLGPLLFLHARVAPLVHAVGEGWAEGRLEIRHEHFVSERVGDLLRALRLPHEERADGPLVLLASLPGEMHGLGLQMAALTLAAATCRVLFLGTEVPITQIASVAREQAVRAVGISISRATGGTAAAMRLRSLRAALPRRIALVVGGEGAPAAVPGLTVVPDLPALDAWARRLRGPGREGVADA